MSSSPPNPILEQDVFAIEPIGGRVIKSRITAIVQDGDEFWVEIFGITSEFPWFSRLASVQDELERDYKESQKTLPACVEDE